MRKPPTGYPIFPAIVFAVFGRHEFLAVVLVQVLLAGLTVLGVAHIARRIDDRWFWSAAILASVWPNMTFRAATLTPETFFTLWLVWGMYFCIAAATAERPARSMILASLFLAVAYATQPALIFLPILLLPATIYLLQQVSRLPMRRALPLALLSPLMMALVTVPQLVQHHMLFGYPVQQTQTGDHVLFWAYPCLSQPLGCGERNREAFARARQRLNEKLAELPEEYRINPVLKSRVRTEVGLELILELPLTQLAAAATGAAAKTLVHPFLSDAYDFFGVKPVYFGGIEGNGFGERLLNYCSALFGSPAMLAWTFCFLLVLGTRGVQAWGIVVSLRDARYRPYLFLLIRDTPPVGMYVLNMFCMRGSRLWGSRLHRACVV